MDTGQILALILGSSVVSSALTVVATIVINRLNRKDAVEDKKDDIVTQIRELKDEVSTLKNEIATLKEQLEIMSKKLGVVADLAVASAYNTMRSQGMSYIKRGNRTLTEAELNNLKDQYEKYKLIRGEDKFIRDRLIGILENEYTVLPGIGGWY